MENLLLLLNKISQLSPLGVFNQEVIVVQNAGMQHWLNLAIANERGISMNMRYALPAQFLWKLVRTLASDDKVPDQSPYSREVLTWRIHQLLALDIVTSDDDFKQATHYWRGATKLIDENKPDKQADLKRYQLATQLADLYEQYLIFRPQWLDSWQHGNYNIDGLQNISESEHKWQGKLWRLLIAQLPYNPVELLSDAIANIGDKKALIPQRISFFGLNTMAPMWLDFINALSEHIEVHFFHLNPCFSYWGDIITQKTALSQLSTWSDGVEDIQSFVGNPILANLGQQGREFISLLQGYSTIDIELFEQAQKDRKMESEQDNASCLHQLQNDILTLSDPRAVRSESQAITALKDDSIVITSCHSALREVQALHDYLLHQFNEDESLTPKDILVMCPQIEQYAPYVNAVFTRGWQDIAGEVPPLPCSIADRSAKDSDPLVAAFSELLTLPDSRFAVSQLMSYLRLPAIADKFAINNEDLDKISSWLEQATVHWGMNQAHKQSLLGQEASASFTWQQGLSRLLRGFSFADKEHIYQNQLLLSHVEGSDAILLGQLMYFIEQLSYFSSNLQQPRSAEQWQTFLLQQLTHLFSRVDKDNNSNENSIIVIEQAIAGLVEHCHHANYQDDISLLIVVDYLTQHFSQGDASKQFMVGQVTFCSMLPMRSIPFKIIAVLGLNDGEFPRQRQALGFDLMSISPAKLGDRSRRGDDRYLFLEAIISARQALYLSYQGRNIKNNNEKQPSLVVKELMEYLSQNYGWQFSIEESDEDIDGAANENDIYQTPMQAFSAKNYGGKWPSFDANWMALGQITTPNTHANKKLFSIDELERPNELVFSGEQVVSFFQHPAKMFAQQQLNIYFEQSNKILEDVEPFTIDHLQSYLLRQQLLEASLKPSQSEQATLEVEQRAKLSGKFPDLPTTKELFQGYQNDVRCFSEEIAKLDCDNGTVINCQISIELSGITIVLTMQMAVKNGLLVHYRSSSAKAKDKFSIYLQQLILQVWQQQYIAQDNLVRSELNNEENSSVLLSQVCGSIGLYFNTKSQKIEMFDLAMVDNAHQKLSTIIGLFLKGQQQPLLLNGNLAEKVFTKKRGQLEEMTQDRFESIWHGDTNIIGLADDYLSYFWPEPPLFEEHHADIDLIYHDVYELVIKRAASRAKKASAKEHN
jgi:exodeoxyribonuclease V gamma subunit